MHDRNGKLLLAAAAALLLAGGPAFALTPQSIGTGAPLIVPVMDQEDLSVEEDLVPDEVPDDMKKSEDRMEPAPEAKGEDAGDVEDEEIKHDLETGD